MKIQPYHKSILPLNYVDKFTDIIGNIFKKEGFISVYKIKKNQSHHITLLSVKKPNHRIRKVLPKLGV